MSNKLADHITARDQLVALEQSGAKLSGAELDFIASFDRAVMDAQDGVADTHYSGFDYGPGPDSGLRPLARAHQILNHHQKNGSSL